MNSDKQRKYKGYKRLTELERLLSYIMAEYPKETFAEVRGTDGRYFISNTGIVISLCRVVPITLKPCLFANGYEYITIDGKKRRIHRLVAEAFLQNDENKPIIHHKDGNKRNNNLNNLTWATYKENTDAYINSINQKKEEQQNDET